MSTPLPDSWVDRIFQKLTLIYGRDFTDRWKGLDQEEVKKDWAIELAGFQSRGEAIAHALQHLPMGRPPTVLEFRELARKAPAPPTVHLPPPAASPAVQQRARQQIDSVRGALLAGSSADPRAWARRLLDRHAAGEPVPSASLRAARQALRAHLNSLEQST